ADDGVVQAVGRVRGAGHDDAGTRDVAAAARRMVAGHAQLVARHDEAVGSDHGTGLQGHHVEAGGAVVTDLVAVALGVDCMQCAARLVGGQTGHRVANDVGGCINAPGGSSATRATGVVGRVATYPAIIGVRYVDCGFQVAVQPVVFDQVAGATVQEDALEEPADVAVAHGHVLLVAGVDAAGLRAIARRQPADLEAVAVDGDVVGGNGDGIAGGDVGGQVAVQAPRALGGNRGGQAADVVVAAAVVAFRRAGGRRDGQPA